MSECTCYMNYPNKCKKRKNGKWKCVDEYICIRQIIEEDIGLPFPKVYKKTKCIKEKSNARK